MVNEKSCNIRLDEIGRLNNILTNNYIIHYIREILSLSSKQKKKRKKEINNRSGKNWRSIIFLGDNSRRRRMAGQSRAVVGYRARAISQD